MFIRSFQFKILNDITFTNSRLAKIGYVQDDSCTFLRVSLETVNNLFYECIHTNQFWKNFKKFWLALSGKYKCSLSPDIAAFKEDINMQYKTEKYIAVKKQHAKEISSQIEIIC